MKLGTKLSMAMGGLSVVLILIGLFGLLQLDSVNKMITEVTTIHLPKLRYTEEANTILSDYRKAEIKHIYATSASAMQQLESEMDTLARQIQDRMAKFEELQLTDEGRAVLREYKASRLKFLGVHEKILALSKNLDTDNAITLLNGESQSTYNEIAKWIDQLVQTQIKNTEQAKVDADSVYSSSRNWVIIFLIVAILIAIVTAFFIIRNVLGQLGKDPGELVAIAHRVSSGDFNIDDGSPKVGVYGNIVGMVETLKGHIEEARSQSERAAKESQNAKQAMEKTEVAMNEAQKKTNAMLAAANRLEEVASIVSSASSELSAQIEQSERGAAEQAARVTETATAMEEMNSTVLEVAKNAGMASDVSANTREKAEQGFNIVKKSVQAILRVQEQSLALKNDMVTLTEHAQSISQIMSVISDIADQTNLLALNAAIEAARAGEAGRGFAVVADEVRKLAEKTMASTTDVGNAIQSIQSSASKSMQQVDEAVKAVEDATGFANQSGDALSEIVKMVDNTADQVRAIATASEEQSASSEEINQSINQVNTIASETARAMQEAAKAISDLASQAQVLSRLIEDMK